MSSLPAHPTPFAAVNGLLSRILTGARTILGRQFIGMYVHGSLALGDFDPCRSDVDFLVATADLLPDETLGALETLHARIAASDLTWKSNYEGSYIPLRALRQFDPADSVHPAMRVDGSFGLDHHGSDWVIQRHVIRERGIVMAGPAAASLVDPVSAQDLRLAVSGVLQEWWAPQLQDPFRLHRGEYQAYAVLTMCRALYTLERGLVVSKPQAAVWAKGRLGSRWNGLIDVALAWRHGVELDRIDETVDFVRYVIRRAEHSVTPHRPWV